MSIQLNNQALWCEFGLIGGDWVSNGSQGFYHVVNPSDGKPIAELPRMGKTEAEGAIHAATKALPEWQAFTAKERALILRRWYEAILEHADDLAKIMTYEQGKPLHEAKAEILYAASFVEWYAEEGKRVHGEILQTSRLDQRHLVLKQPVGVGAGITPWNFPSAMLTRKVAPALAAGCTFILKPAEDTPMSALALARLAIHAGLPRGVLSVLTGSREDAIAIGPILSKSPLVRKLSFTGSAAVGKKLLEQSASTVKKVSLELGGCAPLIVFNDADIKVAVAGTMASKFRNAGQTCVCANRILVQKNIYNRFLEAIESAVSELKVGDGFEEGVTIGPLINKKGLEKVDEHVRDAERKGATLIKGGKPASHIGEQFYEPTILHNVEPSMLVMSEETFGPVLPIMSFDTEEEAIAIANDTPAGLAGYFFTQDAGRLFRVGEALEYGIVVANSGIFSTETIPFGGVKEAGLGREGARQGIEEWCETKFFCVGGL
jgi:succinate-semialdehyde dehydrogenase/glutarate-semialdehyde dehydrogenase